MVVSFVGRALIGAETRISSAFGKINKRIEKPNSEFLQNLKPAFEGIQTNPDSPSTGKGFPVSRLLDLGKEFVKNVFFTQEDPPAQGTQTWEEKLGNLNAQAAEHEPEGEQQLKEDNVDNAALLALLAKAADD